VAEFAESDRGQRGGWSGFWVGCLLAGAVYYWWRKRGCGFRVGSFGSLVIARYRDLYFLCELPFMALVE
jgi:hypothetical protein